MDRGLLYEAGPNGKQIKTPDDLLHSTATRLVGRSTQPLFRNANRSAMGVIDLANKLKSIAARLHLATHVMSYLRRDFAQHMPGILDLADTRMLMPHDQKYRTIDTTYARGPAAVDVARYRGGELDPRDPRNAARAASYMEFREQGFAVRGIVARTLEQEDGGVTVASSSNIAAIVEIAKQGKQLGPQEGLDLLKGKDQKLDKIAEEM